MPRIDAVPGRPVTLHVRIAGVLGPHTLRISNDGITSQSSCPWELSHRLNHVSWSPPNRNLPNRGVTRLLPDVIDFSTAHVVKEYAHGWGGMRFGFAADHLLVEVQNATSGGIDFDLTVTFEANGVTLANRLSAAWDVKYYSWKPSGKDPVPRDWDTLVRERPLDQRGLDRIDFRGCDQPPYQNRFAPPSDKVPPDYFALVATSDWDVPAGRYEVSTLSDDGVRVFIDDRKVIDLWHWGGGQVGRAEVALAGGPHPVRVEYFQAAGPARLQLALRRLGEQ